MKELTIILIAFFITITSVVSAAAQRKIVPIIETKIGGLLGGVQNGKYLDAETTVKAVRAEENYSVYSFDQTVSRWLKLKNPAKFCPDDFYNLDFPDAESGELEKGGTALGDGFDWNPLPRRSQPIRLDHAEYKRIVGDFLRTRGIAKPIVTLTQAVRIDLEGDGKDEVLLAATRFVPYTEKDRKKKFDEYSVVLLRKIVNGRPQTIFLAGDVLLKNPYDYDASRNSVSSILDLNGDGRLEIVVYQDYDERRAVKVFEILRGKASPIKQLSVENGGECY